MIGDLTQEFIDWLDEQLALEEWNRLTLDEQVETALWARVAHREEHRTGSLSRGIHSCRITVGPVPSEDAMQEADRRRFRAGQNRKGA